MKYVHLNENNIVDSIQYYWAEGFIAAPDDVYAGYSYDPVLNVFSPPPPPPLARWDFEERMRTRLTALAEARFQALVSSALALSPNFPDLPQSLEAFDIILDGMTLP